MTDIQLVFMITKLRPILICSTLDTVFARFFYCFSVNYLVRNYAIIFTIYLILWILDYFEQKINLSAKTCIFIPNWIIIQSSCIISKLVLPIHGITRSHPVNWIATPAFPFAACHAISRSICIVSKYSLLFILFNFLNLW
jgi:hypothetical protein